MGELLRVQILRLVLGVSIAVACIFAAGSVRAPNMSAFRPWLLIAVVAVAGALILVSLAWRRQSGREWLDRLELTPAAIAALALAIALTIEGQFRLDRWAVRHAEPDAVAQLGRHIVVGYRDPAFVRDLVERRAIAGVFLTQRNAANRDAASIAREIAELQAIRARQGLPPLWIATDQEGGAVSRMSPPLERQPPLARVIQGAKDADERRAAVAAYATQQGKGLAALGVNLNFAPVVDLDFGVRNPNDAYTRISDRAIAADAGVVSEVAGWYCDGLAAQNVQCTLKHFPGLGRVFDDTHMSEATLRATADELEAADWIPFRRSLGRSSHVLMVGHVRLPALDAAEPVSTSQRAINGLLRERWGYDGIVITDDLCMGAISNTAGGMAQAGIRALNAGVDLLLINWDGEQIYPVLAALLSAQSELNHERLQRSADRLRAMQAKLPSGTR